MTQNRGITYQDEQNQDADLRTEEIRTAQYFVKGSISPCDHIFSLEIFFIRILVDLILREYQKHIIYFD